MTGQISILFPRDLLRYACFFAFVTRSLAEHLVTCSENSDSETCYVTIKENSYDEENYIELIDPRKTLKCISCNMYTLTEIVCENSSVVEIIDFSRSRIKNIRNMGLTYSDFTNVRSCNLSHNEIGVLSIKNTRLIVSSKLLEVLDLSHNQIELVFHSNGLNRLSSRMTDLILSHNKIYWLDPESFSTKKQLRTLKLNNNKIVSFSASLLVYLENLLHLDLSFNEITYINDSNFRNLKNLRTLKLNNNKLTTVPKTFDSFESLKELDLSNNLIKTLDFDMSTISKNSNFFSNNTELIILNLSSNNLSDLHISCATSLKTLNVSDNRISSAHLLGTSALEVLDLSKNNLTDFFGEIPALKEFYVGHNTLSSFQNISKMLSNELHTLDLCFNQLKDINASTLSRFTKLKYLNVQQSGLHSVNPFTFAAQTELHTLDISYNNLKYFRINTSLSTNKNLTELYLDGNALTVLDLEHVSDTIPRLKSIGISDNAWPCSYLSTLLVQLNASEVEIFIRPQRSPDRRHHISGVGCVTSFTFAIILFWTIIIFVIIVLLVTAILILRKCFRCVQNKDNSDKLILFNKFDEDA